jgi:DNA-binding transcriptional MerR regulator
MKRSTPSASAPTSFREGVSRAEAARAGLLEEREIAEIERAWPNGLTSRQIVDVFETRGIRFSEATLRKYVQLGLLPRSVRVGRKGKHRGSCGLYPALVIRRVNTVKVMMAEDRTIEEIQRSFQRFQDDIDSVQNELRDLIAGIEREAKSPRGDGDDAETRRSLEQEIIEAKRAAGELVRRISSLERRISARAAESSASGPAVGGGSDLY